MDGRHPRSPEKPRRRRGTKTVVVAKTPLVVVIDGVDQGSHRNGFEALHARKHLRGLLVRDGIKNHRSRRRVHTQVDMRRSRRSRERRNKELTSVPASHAHRGEERRHVVAVSAPCADNLPGLFHELDVVNVPHVANVLTNPVVDGEHFAGVVSLRDVLADVLDKLANFQVSFALVREATHPFQDVDEPWSIDSKSRCCAVHSTNTTRRFSR